MTTPITNDTYADEMNAVILTVQMLDHCRVEDLLTMVHQAETLGPILEPTAYSRGGHKRLDEQRRILEASASLVKVWRKIQTENAS